METLLKDIIRLSYMLEDPAQQSAEFKRGLPIQSHRLDRLESQFEELKETINSHDIHEFSEIIAECNDRLDNFRKAGYEGLVELELISQLYVKRAQAQENMKIKQKYPVIGSLQSMCDQILDSEA